MATRGILYSSDDTTPNRFTTSAGRWAGTAAGTGSALANLRNLQCRKVLVGEGIIDAGVFKPTKFFEVLIVEKVLYDTLNTGDAPSTIGTINGLPIPSPTSPAVQQITRKVQESLRDFVERGS